MKNVSIIGSCGSIGRQTVEVIKNHSDKFQAIALVTNENEQLLLRQGEELGARFIGLFSKHSQNSKVLFGEDCYSLASIKEADIVVIASSGIATLPYLVEGIKAGKTIALANKECIVAAGEILMPMIKKYNAMIIPVDSEHSAIWQSLQCGKRAEVKKLILTASGGPFFGKTKEQLKKVTVNDALSHPTWSMGRKITIDSATMMNKGLEVIEARWLFDIDQKDIDVVVHRESVIHSLVEFNDGAVICEMSNPTMEIPIQLALSYPDRLKTKIEGLNLAKLSKLTFYPLDNDNFPFVNLARESLKNGGFYPTILNSANEIAVQRFLNNEISFLDIYKVVSKVLDKNYEKLPLSIENIYKIDNITREIAKNIKMEN